MPDASQQHFMNEALEKARKAAALQEKIKEKLTKKPDLVCMTNYVLTIMNHALKFGLVPV